VRSAQCFIGFAVCLVFLFAFAANGICNNANVIVCIFMHVSRLIVKPRYV